MSELRVNDITNLGGTIPDGVGRIVQIVRATDTTNRTTTSGTFVDVTGMSVTITPTSASSNVFVIATFQASTNENAADAQVQYQITDSSNVGLSGAEAVTLRAEALTVSKMTIQAAMTLIGFDSPSSTSAQSYKLRFREITSAASVLNANNTGQLIAIEVAA